MEKEKIINSVRQRVITFNAAAAIVLKITERARELALKSIPYEYLSLPTGFEDDNAKRVFILKYLRAS